MEEMKELEGAEELEVENVEEVKVAALAKEPAALSQMPLSMKRSKPPKKAPPSVKARL